MHNKFRLIYCILIAFLCLTSVNSKSIASEYGVEKLYVYERDSGIYCARFKGMDLKLNKDKCFGNVKKTTRTTKKLFGKPLYTIRSGFTGGHRIGLRLKPGREYNIIETVYVKEQYGNKAIVPYYVIEINGYHYVALAGNFEGPEVFYSDEINSKLKQNQKFIEASTTLSKADKKILMTQKHFIVFHKVVKNKLFDFIELYEAAQSQLTKWKLSNTKKLFEQIIKIQENKAPQKWINSWDNAPIRKWTDDEITAFENLISSLVEEVETKLEIVNAIRANSTTSTLLADAKEAIENKDYKIAKKLLKKLLKENPNSIESSEGRKLLKAVKIGRGYSLARDNLKFAKQERRSGSLGNAVGLANIALKQDPNYLEAKEFLKEVKPLWEKQQQEYQTAQAKLEEKARKYYNEGQYLKAGIIYSKLHNKDPKKSTEKMILKCRQMINPADVSSEEDAYFLYPSTIHPGELLQANKLDELVGHVHNGLFEVIQVLGLGKALVKQYPGNRIFLIRCTNPKQSQFIFTKGRTHKIWLKFTGYKQYTTIFRGQSGAITADALHVVAY